MTNPDCEAAGVFSGDSVVGTHFADSAAETDKTDETCVPLTNDAFLAAIFDGLVEQNRLRISAIVTGRFGIVTGAPGIVTVDAQRGGLRG